MRLTARTDKGKVRSDNQDDYRASLQEKECAWAVVCDGMGGANGGSVASETAVSLVEDLCIQTELCSLCAQERADLAAELVAQANEQVFFQASQDPSLQGMGTTMVLALLSEGHCTLASVGDSRAYRFHDGKLEQLTTDHSMVQELVDKGLLTRQEAEHHPRKNVITRAVGIHPTVESDIICAELEPEDMLLLCTDGLTNALGIEQIEGILQDVPFYNTAEQLIQAVLQQDEQDNTTVVVLSLQ